MVVFHEVRPTPWGTTTGKHQCGCQGTNHTLPKLVSFLRDDGHQEASYGDETPIPEDIGLQSVCAQCQLKTERGVESAIGAIHCGPDSLIEPDIIEWMFISLIELRLQEEGPSIPEKHEKSKNSYLNKLVTPVRRTFTISSKPRGPIPRSTGWDWEYIWYEWTKAFELRRDRVDVAVFLRDLSELPIPSNHNWWAAVLRKLGVEAFVAFETYVSGGLVSRPSSTELSALRRHVEIIQSIDDLFDLYVNIDARVLGYLHAHKMLRTRWQC
ncbi:hypothetical protein E0Z10_g9330 [Xylaria hypoxylon]|uniref:Uncharacterized protein n=1 Tax=Xylaria hypoxylon TaxID=37992 RepID=A0A4Z0Y942_9PEZI|nr:hypothetical protein E0Z10_g9330 [Xylaria hypoxylon]